MLIKCPECEICYRIEADLLPEQGRKLRCFKCGKVWLAHKEDLLDEAEVDTASIYQPDSETTTPADTEVEAAPSPSADDSPKADAEVPDSMPADAPQSAPAEDSPQTTPPTDSFPAETSADIPPAAETNAENSDADSPATENSNADSPAADNAEKPSEDISNDMQEMFSRLNKQTEIIDDYDKKSSSLRKGGRFFAEVLHWHNPVMRVFILLGISTFLLLSVFSFRYELTRAIPPLRHFYNAFGFDSVVIGEGLEFQNINRREYEEDYVRKLEIKGLIFNNLLHHKDWIKDKDIIPAKGSANYSLLYILLVILDKIQPENILEFGFGQTTKLTTQYEKFFKTANSSNTSNGQNIVNKKYDLIIIGSSTGSDKIHTTNILDLIPQNLAEDFVIILDDAEHESGQNTTKLIFEKLDENNIKYSKSYQHASKSQLIITSDKYKFISFY